ncbi:class I SAM-dependent methyltransferase [Thalassotalea litorea]|uniref:Class I SAM-dependent methyltransferase n=1 Tax=Thalassotalea litorea TaxID=2020715 RepID=A0A5R9IND9_9GAMM|nr:methyltransferase domain-containing protein [Thalassotalea litorea]TLU64781.1 class I SAM-dependent methyltransferase [Thalassotalea litorea]
MNLSYQGIFEQRGQLYQQAMSRFPNARDEEFNHLLKQLPVNANQHVADLPAGGGYLSQYLHESLDQENISYTAIETSQTFFDFCPQDDNRHRILCPLNHISLADQSQDSFYSLAGMHHTFDRLPIYQEIYRVLKPGGKGVIADVLQGCATGKFLNEFVHRFNSIGHHGMFLDDRDFTAIEAAGLDVIAHKKERYHWRFKSLEDMARYCQMLFGLDLASLDEIVDGIGSYLGYQVKHGEVLMNWSLLFITVKRPESLPIRIATSPGLEARL